MADVEGAAGHTGRIGFGDCYAMGHWIGALDGSVGGSVKGAGIIKDIAWVAWICGGMVERREACVEVIETGVG